MLPLPAGPAPGRLFFIAVSVFLALALGGCAGMLIRDPVRINMVGIEPLAWPAAIPGKARPCSGTGCAGRSWRTGRSSASPNAWGWSGSAATRSTSTASSNAMLTILIRLQNLRGPPAPPDPSGKIAGRPGFLAEQSEHRFGYALRHQQETKVEWRIIVKHRLIPLATPAHVQTHTMLEKTRGRQRHENLTRYSPPFEEIT
jgi:hypothetical protein